MPTLGSLPEGPELPHPGSGAGGGATPTIPSHPGLPKSPRVPGTGTDVAPAGGATRGPENSAPKGQGITGGRNSGSGAAAPSGGATRANAASSVSGGTTPDADYAGAGASTPRGRKVGANFESAVSWEWWWHHNGSRFFAMSGAESSPSTGGRSAAALEEERVSLAERTRKSTLPFLRAGMSDADPDVRAASILAIGRCGDRGCETLIVGALADESIDVREIACLALGLLGTETARSALRAIVLNSDEASRLTGRAKGASLPLRGHAAAALGLLCELYGPVMEDIDALVATATTKNPNADINLAAIYALGLTRSHQVVPTLIEIAGNGETDVIRARAVSALGRIGHRAALGILSTSLTDDSVHVRRSAAIAAGAIANSNDHGIVERLIELTTESPDAATRRFSMMALAHIAGKAEVDHLVRLLDADDAFDAAFAALAIGVAGSRQASIDRRVVGRKILAGLRDSSSCKTTGAYAIACGLLAFDEAASDIEQILVGRAHGHVRAECAQALALMRHHASLRVLANLAATDDDPEVQGAALQAVARLGGGRTADLVASLVDRSGGRFVVGGATLRAFGYMRDGRVVAAFGRALRDVHGRKAISRAYAAWALGVIGDRTDVSPIRGLACSENYVSQTGIIIDLLSKSKL